MKKLFIKKLLQLIIVYKVHDLHLLSGTQIDIHNIKNKQQKPKYSLMNGSLLCFYCTDVEANSIRNVRYKIISCVFAFSISEGYQRSINLTKA